MRLSCWMAFTDRALAIPGLTCVRHVRLEEPIFGDQTVGGLIKMEWLFVIMLLGCWVLPSIMIGLWAERNGKTFLAGFAWSFFVSPLVGAILVVAQGDKRGAAS